TGSRISLGHMKYRSGVGSRSPRRLVVIPLLLASLFLPRVVAAQKKAAPSKGRSHGGRVQMGIDVLEAEKFAPLRGKHVGLITNHTGVDFQGKPTIDALAHAPGVQLVALFSPEHGIAGHSDEKVASTKDASTGLPIYSLYGDH